MLMKTSTKKLNPIFSFIRQMSFALFFISTTYIHAQEPAPTTIKIRGKVIDNRTLEAIPFCNVTLLGMNKGVQTDFSGNYSLTLPAGQIAKIQFSFVGYTTQVKEINPAKQTSVNIRLKAENNELGGVTVKGKKGKYSNKDNPAVVLIRKVIANKQNNRKEHFDYYKYNQYEKLEFDLSNVNEKFRNSKVLKRFDFIFNYLDTSSVTGTVNLGVYLRETNSDVVYRKNPKATREYVYAQNQTDLGGFLGKQGVSSYLESLYQDVNIYDNSIALLANSFLGPVSTVAPNFYKFVIIDTVKVKGVKCVNLGFSPRNPEDMLFQGSLFVALDSTYAIRKAILGFGKEININFVKDLRIVQEYDDVPNVGLIITKDELSIDFGILKKENGMGMYGQRTVMYKNWEVNKPIPDEKFGGIVNIIRLPGYDKPNKNWDTLRHEPLSQKEFKIQEMVDSVKKAPAFQRLMNLATLVLTGWKPFSIFEIGPVNSFYSFNPIEGVRLRFGGRTLTEFSTKWLLEYYGAYGFKDERYKYFAGVTYSLSDRSVYEYPLKALRATAQSEIKIPGQELQFVQEDNFLLSFKRGANDKMTYNRFYNFEWVNESDRGVSFTVGIKNLLQERTGNLDWRPLGTDGKPNPAADVQKITTTELNFSLRYGPNEQFFVGKNFRVPIVNRYPVFNLRYSAGIKGLFGGDYDYHRVQMTMQKRFFLPPIGYTDMLVEGGKTFGSKLPFMLLNIHRANQTYSYQPGDYNLMNFMEFISDQYATVAFEHDFSGFFFNKIPLLKKANLRELIIFKALWGGVTNANLPSAENALWDFPRDDKGNPISFTLDNRAYIEAGFGVANVFKLFRVYLVKRFTYLEKPNIADGYNIRFRVKFDF
jgi:hypothetical protein